MKTNAFNLKLAQKGEKVVTREGRDIRLICFDHMYRGYKNIIIGLLKGKNIHEMLLRFNSNGINIDHIKNFDLQMANFYEIEDEKN